MVGKQEITIQIEQISNFQTLIETYQEIAAIRMRNIKSGVIISRDFITEITHIFQQLKLSYKSQIQKIMQQKQIKSKNADLSVIKRNGKSVIIFFSSNTGLYGQIIPETYRAFLTFYRKNPGDVAILGRLGRTIFQADNPGVQFTYFDVPDININEQTLEKILHFVLEYEKIYIFYGKFESMARQLPVMLDVYGMEEAEIKQGEKPLYYIFEPSLEKILLFFEEEIFSSIIDQALRESELAKFASRMVNLDNAKENIKKRLTEINFEKRLLTHRLVNKKQMESLGSMSLWRTR